jgi:hypothetical protein
MELTSMEWVRAALQNAGVEGLTLQDTIAMAEHARTPERFDYAVNELVRTVRG